MRSVLVHFEKSKEQVAREWLNDHLEHSGVDLYPWLARSEGDSVLWFAISDFFDDWEPDDLSEFRSKFPQPSAYIQIDISGRIPGDREVREAVIGLLSEVPGSVAEDDYTNHLWTHQEIDEGFLVGGHPFFDYRGWHSETSGLL